MVKEAQGRERVVPRACTVLPGSRQRLLVFPEWHLWNQTNHFASLHVAHFCGKSISEGGLFCSVKKISLQATHLGILRRKAKLSGKDSEIIP